MTTTVVVELWHAGQTVPAATFAVELGVSPAGFGLADPLEIVHSVPPGDFWPAQPEPSTCRFELVLDGFPADLPTKVGDPVAVEISDPAGVAESFHGRVGACTITPVTVAVPGGDRKAVRVQYTCVGYYADLGDEVPNIAMYEDNMTGRVAQITVTSPTANTYGVRYLPWFTDDGEGNPPPVLLRMPALDPGTDSMAAMLEDLFFVTVPNPGPAYVGYLLGAFRYVLLPSIIGGLQEVSGVQRVFEAHPRYQKTVALVATVTRDPATGKVSVTPVPTPVGGVTVDACFVDRETQWERVKGDQIGQVAFKLDAVAGSGGGYNHGVVQRSYPTAPPPPGVGVARKDGLFFTTTGTSTDLDNHINNMGALYGPQLDPEAWTSGELVWHRSADPAAPGKRLPAVGANTIVVVEPIPDDWTPLPGRTWMAGQLTSHKVTVEGGQVSSTVRLRETPVTPGDPALLWRWQDFATITPSPTWADLNPADRWADYAYTAHP
jgi:hypothetical protein